jgi:shikimate kinase
VLGQGYRRPIHARPGAMAELHAILAAREPLYARAEITVVTTGKRPAALAREVLERLGWPVESITPGGVPSDARSPGAPR